MQEPLAAEIEARVRQEAEREALKQIAIQEGERLPDVDEEAALNEDEPLDDYDDGEVPAPRLSCVSMFWCCVRMH